jgi:Trypsin-co-occurring domain 1
MSEAVEFPLSDGTMVRVAPAAQAGSGPVGLGTHLRRAELTLRQSLSSVTSAAAEVIGEFRNLAHRPDEVEVTFGVVLDGKLGGVIASANASAHLDVRVKWNNAPAPNAAPAPDGSGPADPGTAAS